MLCSSSALQIVQWQAAFLHIDRTRLWLANTVIFLQSQLQQKGNAMACTLQTLSAYKKVCPNIILIFIFTFFST